MATWTQIEAEAPELAAAAHKVFEAHIHKTLATIRKDGSPRISGTEAKFFRRYLPRVDARLPQSRRPAARPTPRAPLCPIDTKLVDGDAKLSGRAVQVTDEATIRRFTGTLEQQPAEAFPLFRIDITDLTSRASPVTTSSSRRGAKAVGRQARRAPLSIDVLQQLSVLDELPRAQVVPPHPFARRFSEPGCHHRVLDQALKERERSQVSRVLEEQSAHAVFDLFLDAAGGAPDDRPSLPHRFRHRQAKALVQALLDDDCGVPLERVHDRGILLCIRHGQRGQVDAAAVPVW